VVLSAEKRDEGDYMDQDFVDRIQKKLTEIKAEIVANLITNNQDFKEVIEALDPKDLVDSASDDIDRKMLEAIGTQDMKRIKLIDSALTRIQQGKYGLCIHCGKRIPQERLEAIPYALMCIECKSAEERRNR
jgi:RNA polymerase-binding protein DksA